MKILVFADVHYYCEDISTALFNKNKKLVQYAVPLLDSLIKKTTEQEQVIDFCVNLGDLIQDANNHDKDIQALEFMFHKLKEMKCPCYSVLGNHDLKMMDSVKEIEDITGQKFTFSIDVNGYHFVFITTEVRPELGLERGGCYKAQYMSSQDMEWLRQDLAQNELPCLIFTHYALAEDSSISDECMFMKNRAEVKDIIKSNRNVLAVFSGHQHITKELQEDGITYYLLGSLSGCTKQRGVPDGVYYELDLKDGNMVVTERAITL